MPFSDLLNRIANFFISLFRSFSETVLFLGSAYDIAFAVVDVLVLSFIFYFILKIVRDSRAWQLLKGILLIVVLGLFSNLLGLTSLGFLLTRTISIFAIAFVVIFQPELRRALETVGRSGFKVISIDESNTESRGTQMIESIVQACSELAEKRTGALIVIERSTPLGDLEEQENAVVVDAAVSTTMLKQIFYVGSPLHDGAIVIRNGRITAARVHIPLSDNYHLRKDLGTRHRAGIGASEIGDTISIVVSEERGTISLCMEGRLYVLDNADALRTQLHRLLIPDEDKRRKRLSFLQMRRTRTVAQPDRRQRAVLMAVSLLLSIAFWLFVQVTVNPVVSQTDLIPLTYINQEVMEEKGLSALYRIETIRVSLSGRRQVLEGLRAGDVTAVVDLAKVNTDGLQDLPVEVKVNTNSYTETNAVSPSHIMISVRPHQFAEAEEEADQP